MGAEEPIRKWTEGGLARKSLPILATQQARHFHAITVITVITADVCSAAGLSAGLISLGKKSNCGLKYIILYHIHSTSAHLVSYCSHRFSLDSTRPSSTHRKIKPWWSHPWYQPSGLKVSFWIWWLFATFKYVVCPSRSVLQGVTP